MIKVTDYIVKYLAEFGIRHVFMVTGGGAMHLNDSFCKYKDKIEVVCNHHEQACAIAAEGYARTTGRLAVVNVTTGPGGLNTLTGLMGQWTDSIPVLYLSGQVKFETTVMSCQELNLRQLGDQEVNIIEVVKPLTKYSYSIKTPDEIKLVLEKAVYTATHGRPGPVWIDVPMNIQGAVINENELEGFVPGSDMKFDDEDLNDKISSIIDMLKKAERPVLIAGHGIRLSGGLKEFNDFIRKLKIPVLTTFNGFDLIPSNHPHYTGRIGTIGNRAGNFALQNSDLAIFLGTRNNIRQISYNWQNFAVRAKKVVVDIDPAELNKPTLKPDLPILCDVKLFLTGIYNQLNNISLPDWKKWLDWCAVRKEKYPVVLEEYKRIEEKVNPYYFIQVLTECLEENSVTVAGNGTACVTLFQAGIVKSNQRFFWNSGCASMGYDLPAAIGACFGNDKKDVICLAGDGSLQMNIQELATLAYHSLPVKIFYLNNDGYISIKQTQDNFFEGRRIGTDKTNGVGLPDIISVAKAYGLGTETIINQKEMKDKILKVIHRPGPVLCEVKLLADYIFAPKLSSEKKPDGSMVSKPLEDMYPFLDREEFNNNMINSGEKEDFYNR